MRAAMIANAINITVSSFSPVSWRNDGDSRQTDREVEKEGIEVVVRRVARVAQVAAAWTGA